jgi:hypothetical protein
MRLASRVCADANWARNRVRSRNSRSSRRRTKSKRSADPPLARLVLSILEHLMKYRHDEPESAAGVRRRQALRRTNGAEPVYWRPNPMNSLAL